MLNFLNRGLEFWKKTHQYYNEVVMKEEKDDCVNCGERTNYNRTDHIDSRIGYVEGAGQLCLTCLNNVEGEI